MRKDQPMIRLALRSATALAAVTLAGPALAGPAQLPDRFSEPAPDDARAKPGPPAALPPVQCRVAFTELLDETWPPGLAGNFFEDLIYMPADRQAWLRSLLEGLARRGIAASFPGPGEAVPADAKRASVTLKIAWLDYHNSVLNGTVAVSFRSTDPNRPFQTYARGDGQKSVTMGSPGGRGAMAMNRAGAQMLDKLAARVMEWCKTA